MNVKKRKQFTLVDMDMINALLSLMETKPYNEISIKEIIYTSKVARCTFYRHYKNKDELLLKCCEEVAQEFSKALSAEGYKTMYDVAIAYFSFWKEHQHFIALLRKNNLLYMFLQSYDEWMFSVSKNVKYTNESVSAFSFTPKIRYYFFFGVNGLWGIANRWLMYGCKETPEELAQYVIGFIVESYEDEPDCRYYDENKKFPYNPCYIKLGYNV